MNRDKNSYTVIYATIMVVLAAILLAGAAMVLKDSQEQNQKVDKMEQILRAVGKTPAKQEVINTYKDLIRQELLVDNEGHIVATYEGDNLAESDAFNANTELAFKQKDYSKLPVYVAELEGRKVYILPLNGAGLWNKIWGYLAVDASNGSTIVGADFGNAGETPGLGAEISTPPFANQFVGKELFKDGSFRNIAVVKPGKTLADQDYVDGISGGTLTSDGVHKMLEESLAPFQKFLQQSIVNQ